MDIYQYDHHGNWSPSHSDTHAREKRLLLDEVIQLKKEKEIMDRDSQRKDSQIMQAHSELDKAASALRSSETKVQLLNNQVGLILITSDLSSSAAGGGVKILKDFHRPLEHFCIVIPPFPSTV